MSACPLDDADQVRELMAAAPKLPPAPPYYVEPRHLEEVRRELTKLVRFPQTRMFEDDNFFQHHWEWLGPVRPDGMRFMTIRGLSIEVRRAAWSFHRRPIPDGHFPRPACGWKECTRPEHLRLFVRGSGREKLGWRDKMHLMKSRDGGESAVTAAARLGVSRSTIYSVIREAQAGEKEGKSWLEVFRDAPR